MAATKSDVASLLAQWSEDYKRLDVSRPSLFEVILAQGRAMEVVRLRLADARYLASLAKTAVGGVNAFRRKECYMNAQKLRLVDYMDGANRLEYCEGYVAWEGAPLPISHAWITLGGKVVDVTLRAVSKHEAHTYFGLPIPAKTLLASMNRTETYSPVIEGPLQSQVLRVKGVTR